MHVTPTSGLSVPDPARGDVLPETGRNVEKSSYWLRRISAGDVVETAKLADQQAKKGVKK